MGLGALLLWGLVTTTSGQVTGQIVQQFFVPFPETDFKTSLQAIAAGNAVSNQIMTTVSIVVGTTNTIIVYDHWEDGYENDLSHPVQASTLIWGDGNTNTPAPGYPSNILPPGAVITLTNVVTLPRNPSAVQYDGRDRIGATKAVTVTRAGWATNIGTLMATATEVYDTSRYGTYFIIPVGTNTTPAIQNFSYSSLHIIAAENGTVVMVDINADGIMDVTNTLNMGESMFVNGGVLSGATVTASKPVQVHQMTGRIGSNYQSRTFAIRPVSQWDTSYYAPVGTTSASYVHNVFLFNQYLTNLTVLYSTQTTNSSFTVTNSSPYKFPMPLNSGAHFYTTNGATFYAVGCNDTGSSTPSNNQNYDWGYALLPAAALTPVVIVGWAPGSDFTSGTPANGSPVWVTPTKAATIYVNYSGNYNTGPLIAPNGHHYDTNYTLAAYQFQTIYNATTKNMTGARIFTVDGTTFAAAWGEDPSTAGTGLPYMDAGTGIIPFPQPVMTKSSQLVVDLNGDGKPGWGDTLEYTVHVQNEGMLALGNVLVLDALPNTVTYVTNSTTLNGVAVADNLVPPSLTAFPLDEAGLELPQIQVGGYSDVKYRVVINAGATSISNAVMGSTGSDPVTSTESLLVAGPVLLAFTGATGNPVSSYVTNSGVYISLTDLIQNTNVNTAQSVSVNVTNLSNGDVESVILTETGTNTGIFRNTSPLPMSSTGVTNKFDGTLRSQAGQFLYVAYTDPVSTNSGYANATVTTAPMPYTTKSSLLVVDQYGNGRITWGDTVQYSILLTNTSAQTMSNLVVRDTLPASVSYLTNSTTTNGVALADSGTTPFPLDETGLSVPRLATNSSILLQFRVTVNSGTILSNSVTVTNLSGLVQAQDVASVSLPPPSCNLSFTDSSGNPVSAFAENTGIYATMTDSSQNTNPTNAQTLTVTITNLSGGDVESLLLTETGTNTGVFRNTIPLPTSTVLGTAQQDGTLNGKAAQVASVSFTGSGGETCSASATFVPAVQTKKLYLSAVNASDLYQNLNRIDPVAAGKTSTSNSVVLSSNSVATFVQTPAFCKAFSLPGGSPVAVTNYVSIASGSMPASPAIRAILKRGTNAANAAAFITLTNAAYSGGMLGWSGTLSTNVNFGLGETAYLVVTSAQSGVSLTIQYNSSTKPSAVILPTTTVISLDQLGLYDAAYPAGNLITNAVNSQTVYIRAVASDPFGASDVTKISVVSLDPGGYAFTTNLTGAYVVASNACTTTYEYPWITENWQGSYSILATAFEGTEGITNALMSTLQVHYPSGGTPSTTSFVDVNSNPTNSYATNETICVRVQDLNMNQNPAAVETVSVVITTTSGDHETVVLNETGTNTGVFTGCINANTNTAVQNNGVLNAPGGAGLTVTYTDPLNPSDTSSDSAIVRLPPGPKPVVSLFKTLIQPANSTVLLGSPVQFDIEVANPGSVTVTNVQLTDTFPSTRLQFVSATIPPNSTTPAGTLTWNNLGPLAPGTNVVISTYFTAKLAGALINSVSVSGTTNIGPVTAAATNSISAIAVSKTLVSPNSGPAYINSNVVFRIAITNTGVNTISSYTLQDQFSSSCFQFLGASVLPSGSGGGVILWSSMSGLAVGASTNIYVTNKVTGDCEPAVNNAYLSSVVDQLGKSVPNAQSSTSITNLGASISGTIWYDANANGTNDTGDSPITSAIVYVDLNGDGVRQGSEPFATTDTNGLYQIVSIPAGNYAVRVDTNSLVAGLRPTYDLDGTNTPNEVSMTISNSQVITGLDFGYVGSGSIGGFAWSDINGNGVWQAGAPGLPGVNVFMDLNANGVRDAGEPYVTTSPDGSFAFNYLVAGNYRVAVDILSLPPNMRPTFDLDGTNTPNVATITLGAGQNITNANFGYQGRANLAGVITDAVTGLPILGATVVVVDSVGTTQTVSTGLSGGYSVASVWTGPASVTASKPGYGSTGANPTIVAGANTQTLSLTANTLVGVITNTATGLPIPGAAVQVVDSASITNTIATDSNGHYGVTNIAAGVATITASQSGYVAANTSPTIVAGANTQDLGLTPISLTGLVTDVVTMLPIAGASVSVTDGSNAVHTVTTDATGHYSVAVLPTGPASVTASKPGYGSTGANPTIVAGANTQNLSLTANTLVGVITNTATGLPIAGAAVQVVDSASITNTTATDSSGHYGITNIAAGVATITASQSSYVAASTSPTIIAGANTQDLGLTPNSLSGVVTDAVTMLPIAGASVSVTDSSNAVHTVTTDSTGHYSVTILPTGPAAVTASRTGYGSAGANPAILAGANTQNLSLTPNTLAGIITDSLSGLPIAGASVTVIDGAGVNTSIVTGPSGAYSVSGIAVSAASVTANMVGYSSANASPVISIGANTQDLKLTPSILAGHVTDSASHQPLAGVLVQVIDGADTTNTTTTDATGYYGVTNIAPGVASVTASKSGYNTATATPTIVAGPNTQDLQLSVSNPTLALLSSIKAYLADDGVVVRWQTASEAGSVSFDLYRKAPAGDNWVKVNAAPVLAANSPTGSTYEVADPDAKPAETLAYRLVELEEQGTTRTYGPFALRAEAPTPAAPPKALVTVTASPLAKAALVRSPQPLAQAASSPLSTLDGSRFIKIITTNSGIQNVTATALGIALGQAPANIQSAIAARSLRLSNQGQPVAYVASADGSGLSFYAEPLKNNYTAQNVYSLTFAPGLSLGTVLSPPTTPVPAATLAYLAELDLEQDLLAVPSLVQDPSQDFWMWQRLVAGIPMFNTATFSFALDHLSVSGSGAASLTLHLLGGDEAIHTVQATLNGSLVGQDTWQGRTAHNTVLQIPSSLLIEGANQLSLQAVATAGSPTSQWYVNGFGLRYPRQYFAINGTLLFSANSNSVITVDGFTSPAITVLEITDPKQPVLVQNLTVVPTDAGYSASFAPSDPQNQFVAFQSGAGTTPASVACAQTANLSRAANAADYIIIAPDTLTATAGQLAAYRQRKGLRPVVVSLDQVYDEFSSGIITPEAIRQFLRTALTNWAVKPRYVVLIGNGTYDYRDLLQQHDNLMPPLLVNTSYGLFCSDSAYGDLNGDGQPEIAVGRLPVKTAQQLLALIGKIQSYEALPQTAPAQALLVADAPDSAGDFAAAIQQVNTTLVGSYSNTVVQGAGQSNLGPVRQAILSSFNAGVDLVDYIGHGAIDRFGNYGYLTSADVAALQNGARLPVVVAVTCVAGQYSVPGSDCLAGYLSMQNAGGAIAVVAPTGLSVDQDASRLNLRLLNLLRANAGPGVGDMFRQALADHVALDNPTTQPAIYNLIGDPALAYNVALQTSAAVPQFTGTSVTNGVLVITWSGGQPPYQLEQTTTLGPKASWQAVGSPVSGLTTTLPVSGPMGFIRVRCSR